MVIINFANKWQKIIIIRGKKNRDKFFCQVKKNRVKILVGKKKVREKFRWEKIQSLAKRFVTFPRLFFPEKVHEINFTAENNVFIEQWVISFIEYAHAKKTLTQKELSLQMKNMKTSAPYDINEREVQSTLHTKRGGFCFTLYDIYNESFFVVFYFHFVFFFCQNDFLSCYFCFCFV